MKKTLIAAAGVICATLPVGSAYAMSSVTDATLQSLNTTHTQIVREAERACSGTGSGTSVNNQGGACALGDVERQVRSTEDADLLAFHQQLPPRIRYNSDRSYTNVKRYF
jgi:hypothetical protein